MVGAGTGFIWDRVEQVGRRRLLFLLLIALCSVIFQIAVVKANNVVVGCDGYGFGYGYGEGGYGTRCDAYPYTARVEFIHPNAIFGMNYFAFVGVGDPESPLWITPVTVIDGSTNITQTIDISGGSAWLPPGPDNPWFLEVWNGYWSLYGNAYTQINSFQINVNGTIYTAEYTGETGSYGRMIYSFIPIPSPDTTPPRVSGVGPSGTTYSSAVAVYAEFADTRSGIDQNSKVLYLDGNLLTNCYSYPYNISCTASGLTVGQHLITGSVADGAGNVSQINGSFEVIQDNVPPLFTNLQPSGTISYMSTIVSAVITDNETGVNSASLSMYVDNNQLTNCNYNDWMHPNTIRCSTDSLSLGAHTITGSATDNAGNVTIIGGSFNVVDVTAPSIYSITPSGNYYTSYPGTISVSYADSFSGIDTASAVVYLDGISQSGCTVSTTQASCNIAGLPMGSHLITGSISDKSGNRASFSRSFVFAIDSTGPTVSSVQPSGTVANLTTKTIVVNYSDTQSGIDTASAAVYLDGIRLTGCSAGSSSVSCTKSNLSLGNHTITGSISDRSGNASAFNGSFVITDTIAPTINGITPSSSVYMPTAMVAVYYSDSFSGINSASAIVYLDGVRQSDCIASNAYISCAVSGLIPGVHTISGSISDNSGNLKSFSSTFNRAIDVYAPGLNLISPAGTTYLNEISARATMFDMGSRVNYASVAVYIDGELMVGCSVTPYNSYPFDTQLDCPPSPVAPGVHSVTLQVSDNAGNTSSQNSTFTVVADITPPFIDGLIPNGILYDDSIWIIAKAYDSQSGNNNSTMKMTMDGVELTGCEYSVFNSTTTFMTCPAYGVTLGRHEYIVTMKDYSGNTGSTSASFVRRIRSSGPPDLRLSRQYVYWESYAAYLSRNLTVMWAIRNASLEPAYNLQITGSTASQGVITTYLDASPGDVEGGQTFNMTTRYSIPAGVNRFVATLSASAEDGMGVTYSYP